jgi:hypothetical protein
VSSTNIRNHLGSFPDRTDLRFTKYIERILSIIDDKEFFNREFVKMKTRIIPFISIALSLTISSACLIMNGTSPTPTAPENEIVGDQFQPQNTTLPPEQTAEPTLAPSTPSATITDSSVDITSPDLPVEQIDPCSLLTSGEAEQLLGESVTPPQEINGACAYNNASDSLYLISVTAAQEEQSEGILQGQAMLLGMTGVPLDQSKLDQLKALAANQDYLAYFTELETLGQNSLTAKAHILKDTPGLEYWVWIEADTRRQGSLVLVRDRTVLNINVIIPDTHTEPDTLEGLQNLAETVYQRLPQNFSLKMPSTATPTEIVISSPWTPTLIPTATEVAIVVPPWESATPVSPGYIEQPSYTGDCTQRPANSICLRYDDGYIWLVYDNAITSWDDAGNWQGYTVRVAHGVQADYYHVLGTNLIMTIMK